MASKKWVFPLFLFSLQQAGLMESNNIKERLVAIVKPVIEELGLELFDIEISGRGRRSHLKIFIDSNRNGVTVDDCAEVSREIEALLEVNDIFTSSYILEVSSPGLDRPLRGIEDFKKYKGNLVRVITKNSINKENFFKGIIQAVHKNTVELAISEGKKVSISVSNISRARLEIDI